MWLETDDGHLSLPFLLLLGEEILGLLEIHFRLLLLENNLVVLFRGLLLLALLVTAIFLLVDTASRLYVLDVLIDL